MKESSANDPKFKQGFEDYAQAKYATNPDNQHAWMTAGTVRMAQHEQAELQPEIAGAMHGGILGGLVNDANHLIDKIPGGQIVGAPLGAGTGALNKGSGILSTQLIGGVSMGNGNNLDVSQNVKGPDGVSVPTDIRGSSGAARAELNQAAADSHTYLGQVQGTGANDYSNLDQRLRVLTANIIAYSDTHIPTATDARALRELQELAAKRFPKGASQRLEPKAILLVEDNAADEDLAILALRKNKFRHEVVVAHDGAEALDYLFGSGRFCGRDITRTPAIVLLDLQLPKRSGFEVLERIRQDDRTRLIPVIILTSSREECDLVRGYSLGANSYIRKPVDFKEFNEVVRQMGLYWLSINEPPPEVH